MKNFMKMKTVKIATVLTFLLVLIACDMQQEGDRMVLKEPGKEIVIIENEQTETETDPVQVSVEKIERYDGMEITDWLDDQNVVLAKENKELEKMSGEANSEIYPKSLYLYNLDSKEYKTVKAQKGMFFGGATLSPDKKHLLFYEYYMGDPAYYLMSMDNLEESIKEEVLGLALTAKWTDDQHVIGVSYAGGAYIAGTDRKFTPIDNLQAEHLFTVQKMQDKIYYTTIENADSPYLQLYMMNLTTGEKKDLKIQNAEEVIPSPNGKQILISQRVGSTKKLLLADAEGNILRIVAEGTELTGVSWAPNQRMIAYQLESIDNGTTSSGLYLYDVFSGKSLQIAVNTGMSEISWSPSSKKIAVAELEW